ncbi:DUF1801 domain-containing protein [Phaeobacter gallaeciensis]|uniref:DUF1801 domain-containing protein n=2 Tax=Roseobacteraceae TaxID=2854170 RepID=A0A366X469_9RHOB|nr:MULTISPECIES: DUF1801 domain-containing protein [Roseobacteraceae]MBT3141961.1 DUF1801 domain-containing protein [Falsiruegeria litorea]MBT8168692.1 DUF1801 domain-containing protein [Falsiruegeria litorea]RBW60042.1 DUF1801 domain-containing protein [Phaeobacter gallaeciensis]
MTPFASDKVAAAFAAIPPDPRAGLLQLRDLIFEVAANDSRVKSITEDLRWGQPAYLSPRGSTLRLGVPKTGGFGLFVHCQSRLMPDYQHAFPGLDRIEGTRALLFDDPGQIDPTRHGWLIARALTYHQKS